MSRLDHPSVAADEVAWITTDQMREVDRVMIEDLHIELIQMMENAGRNLARLVLDRFGPARVAVYAGTGGNGGGGLVAARHLANAGVAVSVVLAADPSSLAEVPAHQLDIVERMGLTVVAEPVEADVAVDAMIGYGLRGDPRGHTAELIEGLVGGAAPIVSLDTPSGLDTTTGRAGSPAISAAATMTLAMPKEGLRTGPEVGDLYLADISVPASVYAGLGVPDRLVPSFAAGSLLRVLR